uniref:Transferrin-like domain-containing protein n=1 Tax=Daphnia galeata TaxID=27404 RepID=A0A8J2RRZ7_9CRUS|nr:unnamed protein product [Daphnia galeata]
MPDMANNKKIGFPKLFWIFVIFSSVISVQSQKDVLKWCTTNVNEQEKCEEMAHNVDLQFSQFGKLGMVVKCIRAFNKAECMQYLDKSEADVTTLDPGNVFVGGRYHSLLPIMQEVYTNNQAFYFSVAVVKKFTLPEVQAISQLRGKKACFPGVGIHGGWVQPVFTLMQLRHMDIVDCNNHVKSASEFFGPSCAVDSLSDIYNPLGDNSDHLCELCASKVLGQRCTAHDPYAGYQGAFKCLVEAGEVAFLKHTTVTEVLATGQFGTIKIDDFELLCVDGTRRSVHEYRDCNWGQIPGDAVVTTSARGIEMRQKYQKFLTKLVEVFGSRTANPRTDIRNTTTFRPFDDFSSRDLNTVDSLAQPISPRGFQLFQSSPRYGMLNNLIFQDDSVSLKAIPADQQTYSGFLGRTLDSILGVRQCPVKAMTLCVTSPVELTKCVRMRTAMKAQLLQPEMNCYRADTNIGCMRAIQTGVADVTMLDAGDIYTAGLNFDMISILSEVYNLGKPEYYVVAVAKATDPETELIYLKNKNTCHTGIYHAAGWIIPLAHLLANERIRSYGCDSVQSAASFFTKACVPGAMNQEYQPTGLSFPHMCDLCHGTSFRFCRRDHSEDYFGNTGAFRCLVEGGGHVAFVRHATVLENTDGKSREYWSRNQLSRDYELLCRDGQRAPVSDYARCNLGKVKANAMVARGGRGYNKTEIDAFINVFMYAQQFYGLKGDYLDFALFTSDPPYNDVIFQDATQKLQIVPPSQRHYHKYLGPEFLRARQLVDCQAGATSLKSSIAAALTIVVFVFNHVRL